MDGKIVAAPHIVILGAGASIAAYHDWGKIGPALPSMLNLIDLLSLRTDVSAAGYDPNLTNFELLYDELASTGKNEELRKLIESRVYEYFSTLSLPEAPTIYDYLVLSLREKDTIASFNWDPFLLQAYQRNECVSKIRRPRICFLHGNVKIGICEADRISGVNGNKCSKCNKFFEPSKLLYPVQHKDYSTDIFIKSEWDALRYALSYGYYLTIFGYSAPKTDVEARQLMLTDWKKNPTLELAEVDIIDIKPKDELEENWQEFFVSHHYGIQTDIHNSYLFQHPRRSCDAFAAATLMLDPWHDNPFPRFKTLRELQDWVKPLVDEEAKVQSEKLAFSGDPVLPNKRT
ncbi:hypothetical protein JQ628_04755 [Bradyrhizobium lablabi]|uniref:hypothetical protein n=1 Tax=Bradyrhizobium lablabi TaxID=722472 RepID=UPI001BA9C775|nr:hypothetical protein [Bradyrhizobium lablabi]MBR1120817.1 hypothetical protein [Bradyrhizobium lablabi]